MICDSRFGCATSGAFGAFVDGIVRSLVHSHGIVMAKTKSRNRSLAARVLVVRLFGPCNHRCLPVGRHLGSRQLDNAIGGRNLARKRFSGSDHQNRGVLIRTDRDDFFRADSLGPSH